jgi:hypothetical protein
MMKYIRRAGFFLLILLSVLQCNSEEKVVVPDGNETGCDLSGAWGITVTVAEGSRIPAGTRFSAVLSLNQTESGEFTGTIGITGMVTAEVTGTVSNNELDFEIRQGAPCIGLFEGSGTVTENCSKLTGKYSGSDCAGTLNADFVSESFNPDAGS